MLEYDNRIRKSVYVVNMINTRQGEHPLFRDYGLGHVTDQKGVISRNQVQKETSKWYPNVQVTAVILENGVYRVEICEK